MPPVHKRLHIHLDTTPPCLTHKIRDTTVAVRHDPEMRAFYERLLSRGKRKKQALVAVVHKLRFGAPTPNEPQADDGEVAGALRGPVPPGGGLTGKTVSSRTLTPQGRLRNDPAYSPWARARAMSAPRASPSLYRRGRRRA